VEAQEQLVEESCENVQQPSSEERTEIESVDDRTDKAQSRGLLSSLSSLYSYHKGSVVKKLKLCAVFRSHNVRCVHMQTTCRWARV